MSDSTDSIAVGEDGSPSRERRRWRKHATEGDPSPGLLDSSSIDAASSVGTFSRAAGYTEIQGDSNQVDPVAAYPEYEYIPTPPGAIRFSRYILGPIYLISTAVSLFGRKARAESMRLCLTFGAPSSPHIQCGLEELMRGLIISKITKNLWSALKQLRHTSSPRRFWIDAICINQNSVEERNHQVPLMSRIYKEATNVYVWIGDADIDSPLALALIEKIRFLQNYDRVIEAHTQCRHWIALTKFMRQE
jgi:hypothetical protein